VSEGKKFQGRQTVVEIYRAGSNPARSNFSLPSGHQWRVIGRIPYWNGAGE